MSQKTVLEMFKEIKKLETADGPKITVEDILPFFCESVEKALQRLESIDQTNPSEALEGLQHIKKYYVPEPCSSTTYDYLETIKQALLKLDFLEGAMDLPTYCFSIFKNRNGDEVTIMRKERYEEYQKVFEIIKEKGLPLVERDMILQSKDYDEYNIKYSWCNLKNASIQKTQEEFELLKAYFGKNIQK